MGRDGLGPLTTSYPINPRGSVSIQPHPISFILLFLASDKMDFEKSWRYKWALPLPEALITLQSWALPIIVR